jgi:hypothetical protein
MKKILNIIIVLILTVSVCFGYSVDIWLGWKSNPTEELVTKYIIYQAKLPSTNFIPVVTVAGTTNAGKVRITSPGTYQFKVLAVNGVGSSGLSDEVQVPDVFPSIPTNFSFLSITNNP